MYYHIQAATASIKYETTMINNSALTQAVLYYGHIYALHMYKKAKILF